jgi:hypothetical protein
MTFFDQASARGGAATRDEIPAAWRERLSDYCALLEIVNGLELLAGRLRVFGVGERSLGRDARTWNEAPWRAAYRLPPSLVLWGENVFGDQYGADMASGALVQVSCEGGVIERLPFDTVQACLEGMLRSQDAFSEDDRLVRAARARGLRPSRTEHLSFVVPLICHGSPEPENLEVMDGETHLEILGKLIAQPL